MGRSDIDIARAARLEPVTALARELGLDESELHPAQ